MKRIFLYLFISIIYSNLIAQKSTIDSLENEIKHYSANDTSKVNLLNKLSHKYIPFDIDKSIENAKEANALAKKLNYKKGEARNLIIFSLINRNKSELDEAEKNALEALKLYEEINNHTGIANSKNSLGTISYYKNDLDKALVYYNEVLSISIKNGNIKQQSITLNNIGNIYYEKGDIDGALSFYKKSVERKKESGEKTIALSALSNIGVMCRIQGNYLEALDYFNQCLTIHKEKNNKEDIARSLLNISAVYYELEQYDKTLLSLEEALGLFKALNIKKNIAGCLINIGAVYADLKEFPKALDFMTKSLAISKEIDDKAELCAGYFQLGYLRLSMQQPKLAIINYKTSLEISYDLESKIYICHTSIGLAQAYVELEEYSKALDFALQGQKIAKNLNLLVQQKLASEILATIYYETKSYKKAFESHQQFKILNDSLFNKENIEKITQLEYEYKYQAELDSAKLREKKLTIERDTTNLSLEKSQRNSLIGIIAFLLVALLFGTSLFFFKLKEQKDKVKYSLMEQKLLRSQMTPHFIFNSLSVLQGIILNKEEKKSIFYLSKFSKLLRIILENSREKTVLLNQELEAVENYITLQNINIDPSCEYVITIDKNINTNSFKIPPMLIQPFIENAFEHAFGNLKKPRKLIIHLSFSNNKLICTIQDNGIGINTHSKEVRNKSKRSLATTITAERLDILSKDFKFKGSITVEDRIKFNEQGTLVTLIIPYLKNKNYERSNY